MLVAEVVRRAPGAPQAAASSRAGQLCTRTWAAPSRIPATPHRRWHPGRHGGAHSQDPGRRPRAPPVFLNRAGHVPHHRLSSKTAFPAGSVASAKSHAGRRLRCRHHNGGIALRDTQGLASPNIEEHAPDATRTATAVHRDYCTLYAASGTFRRLRGGRKRAQCLGMMNFTDLASFL